MRRKLEEERHALIAFVGRFDSLGLASEPTIPSRLRQPSTLPLGPTAFASRRRRSYNTSASANSSMSRSSSGLTAVPEVDSPDHSYINTNCLSIALTGDGSETFESPIKGGADLAKSVRDAPSLLDFSTELAEVEGMIDLSFEGAQTSFSEVNGQADGIDKFGEAIGTMDISDTPTGTPTGKASERGAAAAVTMEDKENVLPVFA